MIWTLAMSLDVAVLFIFFVVAVGVLYVTYDGAASVSEAYCTVGIAYTVMLFLLLLLYAAGTFTELQEYLLYRICPGYLVCG